VPKSPILVADDIINLVFTRGLVMTDEIRVTIAAQIAIMVLGLPQQYFDRVQSILVYPRGFIARQESDAGGGFIMNRETELIGEVWMRGAVVVAWADALANGRGERPGNVVLHEFAHEFDRLAGDIDGIPPLENSDQYRRWIEVVNLEFRQLVHRCHRGLPTLLDCYAATNRKEFFAVATETFFTRPHAMRRRHAELYTLFSEVYRQDPAADRPEDADDAGESEDET
jgi:MtfA peptidase